MPPRPPLKVVGRRLDPDDYRLRDFFRAPPSRTTSSRRARPRRMRCSPRQGHAGRRCPWSWTATPFTRARPSRASPAPGACTHIPIGSTTTSSSWARDRPASRRRCTGPQTGCPRPWPRRTCLAARRPTRLRSRTSSASSTPSAGPSSHGSPGVRRSASAPSSCCNGVVRGHLQPGEMPSAELASGDELTSDIVIVAPGMEWRRLELDGVEELLGHGVYYGAGRSEAVQCAGQARRCGGRRQLGGPGRDEPGERRGAGDAGGARRQSRQVHVGLSRRPDRGAGSDRGQASQPCDGCARAGGPARRGHDRVGRLGTPDGAGLGDVPLHRRRAAHRLGAIERRSNRSKGLHPHGPRSARQGDAAGRLAARSRSTRTRDEHPGVFAAGDVRQGP